MTDDEARTLRAALDENVALRDNLKATQERCSQLLGENRAFAKALGRMRRRWVLLLESMCWEEGPDPDRIVGDYELHFVERKPHNCATDGHSYGHGDACHFCGLPDPNDPFKENPVDLDVIKLTEADIEVVPIPPIPKERT